MGYRMSVKGSLAIPEDVLSDIELVLEKRQVKFARSAEAIEIDHADRNMNPGDRRLNKALLEIARILDKPQSLTLWDEFQGEYEVVIGNGRVKEEVSINIWSSKPDVPAPDQILDGLRKRGLPARLTKVKGRRGGARQFEFQPLTGGASCRVNVKRRFWDSYDLLSVPNVTEDLCEKYNLDTEELRKKLYNSAFGMEIRNPATGDMNTDLLYESLVEVIEELTGGILTTVG